MTYQVFARKWRPKSFLDLVGQEPVKLALSHSLKTGRVHHAYLFCGTRGVGKTTLGRLLAKCLNCEQGLSPEPCGVCAICTAIDAGNFIDVIEVDAASKTRVEDTRELLENVQYLPAQGRYKIYLIDEVHMLSTHSFNALLKTLEEPPEHVKFILATTDPDKIPATVLSRCLKFMLRPIPESLIVGQLIKILEQENIAFEKTALPSIAMAAEGSMRDALSLLEQAVLVGEGILGHKEVQQLLGWVAPSVIQTLLQLIIKKEASQIRVETDYLVEIGADFGQVLDKILEAFYHISLIQQILPREIDEINGLCVEWRPFAEHLSPEEVQLCYQIALVGKQELIFAPSQRIGFEMTLLRMLAFYPNTSTILAIPEDMPEKPEKPEKSEKTTLPLSMNTHQTQQNNPPQVQWHTVLPNLSVTGLTKMLASNCELSYFAENEIHLTLDKSQEVCLTSERQKNLQEALSSYFNKMIKLKIILGNTTQSPMQLEKKNKQIRSEAAMTMVANDPLIQNLVQTFGAEIESMTILEPEKKI